MIRKINFFFKLSTSRKILVVQALGLSVYTYFLFRFFNRLARFGEKTGDATTRKYLFQKRVTDMAWAIQITAKYIPWKNVCRHQAYQAKMLCNYYRVPCLIFIGFKKNIANNQIEAHAWTMANGKMITGFCNPDEYTVQSIYKNKWQ